MRFTRALRKLRRRPWLGFAVGLGIFVVALGLRVAIGDALRELRIMQNLAQQLRGEVSCEGTKGATTRLVFPVA
jgi:hypothetical protein